MGTRTATLSCGWGRAARQLAEVHGGRILSTYWTEGDCQMIIAFEGRGEEQALKVYDDLASQQDVDIRMVRALTEGRRSVFLPLEHSLRVAKVGAYRKVCR